MSKNSLMAVQDAYEERQRLLDTPFQRPKKVAVEMPKVLRGEELQRFRESFTDPEPCPTTEEQILQNRQAIGQQMQQMYPESHPSVAAMQAEADGRARKAAASIEAKLKTAKRGKWNNRTDEDSDAGGIGFGGGNSGTGETQAVMVRNWNIYNDGPQGMAHAPVTAWHITRDALEKQLGRPLQAGDKLECDARNGTVRVIARVDGGDGIKPPLESEVDKVIDKIMTGGFDRKEVGRIKGACADKEKTDERNDALGRALRVNFAKTF